MGRFWMENYPRSSKQVCTEWVFKRRRFVDCTCWCLCRSIWKLDSEGSIRCVLLRTCVLTILTFALPTLTEKKPISVMGITHALDKDVVRDACIAGYPRLVSDLKVAPENRGLLTFISDHIVDFGFLAQDEGSTQQEEPSMEKNEAPDYISSASHGGTPLVWGLTG